MAVRQMEPLDVARYRKIVVLTGAGISVASGIRPFRGPGGLWDEHPELAGKSNAAALARDAGEVWRVFGASRSEVDRARPNAAHLAIAALERRLSGRAEVTVVTQNIDGLHLRAGSQVVIELHGRLCRTRCTDPQCRLEPFVDVAHRDDAVPTCPCCRAPLRPDIVLFDEPIPANVEWATKKALRDCDLFIAVGTSGTVSPASNFVRSADYEGARTILVNLEPMTPRNPYFHEEILGPAEDVLPALLGVGEEAGGAGSLSR